MGAGVSKHPAMRRIWGCVVDGKETFSGAVALASPGVEVSIVEVPVLDDDYIITGWVDLSAMPEGTTVEVCLELRVAAGAAPSRLCARYRGPLDSSLLHVRPMYLPRWSQARLVAILIEGEGFTAPYWVAIVKPDIGLGRLLFRRFA